MGSLPPNTAFDQLIQQLSAFPLWMKQVLYAQLRNDLETCMSKATLDAFSPEHTLQLWVPELTRQGQGELEQPSGQFAQGIYRLLHLVKFRKNVVNITILNNWSLEQCAQHLLHAIDRELVMPPRSAVIMGTVEYLAGKTRLGEYLVKINRLTVEQLDQALRTQKAIQEAMGERTGIANVLINLGYIKREDSEGILFLKEESKKALQTGLSSTTDPAAVARLQQQLQQAMARIRQLEAKNGP
ncbi:MAG TPA: hypothetical protein V6C99_02640 [Oculatellaceae cyanobacterium]|jgi:hypothetical protein